MMTQERFRRVVEECFSLIDEVKWDVDTKVGLFTLTANTVSYQQLQEFSEVLGGCRDITFMVVHVERNEHGINESKAQVMVRL